MMAVSNLGSVLLFCIFEKAPKRKYKQDWVKFFTNNFLDNLT